MKCKKKERKRNLRDYVSQGEKSLSLKYETKADTVMAKLIDLTT